MPKCPLNNFQECDKECAWYFNGIKKQRCSMLNLIPLSYLGKLSEIETEISNIQNILNMRLPK